MKKLIAILLTIFTISLIGCASTEEIPADLTVAQLIQKGQNAYELGDYKGAQRYYETVITRYGTNTENYIEAKYELGHLFVKTKEYKKAYDALSEIKQIYEYASYGDLPASYNKLADIAMAKIPESKLKEFQNKSADNSVVEEIEE